MRLRFFLFEAVQFGRHRLINLARLAQVRLERAQGAQLLQLLLACLTLPILALLAFFLGLLVKTLENAVLTLDEGSSDGDVFRCRILDGTTRKLP